MSSKYNVKKEKTQGNLEFDKKFYPDSLHVSSSSSTKIISAVIVSLRGYWHGRRSVTIDIATVSEGPKVWIPNFVGSNKVIAIR